MSAVLHGVRAEDVLDLMRCRRDQGGHVPDGRKIALVVEGGGMRGVLSAGSLLALDLLGFRSVFDVIYATSAGAVNAAYFLSGQGSLGITVYFDSISNRRFFNPLRIGKILDVDYVYDHVVTKEKPLREEPIRSSRTDLLLSVTDVETGTNDLLSVRSSSEPIPRILKASSALPVLYNRVVELDGRRYVDGGLSCQLPVRAAIEHGATDVVVLLSYPSGYVQAAASMPQRFLFHLMMGAIYPKLGMAYATQHVQAAKDRGMAFGQGVPSGVNVATICPTDDNTYVELTTIDRERLIAGARWQSEMTFDVFGASADPMESLYAAFIREGHG